MGPSLAKFGGVSNGKLQAEDMRYLPQKLFGR